MLRIEDHDEARVLVLAHGKANALDEEFLGEIADAVRSVEQDPPRGLVLTAEGSIFCAGLDLPSLIDADEARIRLLAERLEEACLALFAFPRPVIAALNGHTIAGGALLSLACDQRWMVEGSAKWGLTEASLGLGLPSFGIELARYALARKVAEKVIYSGGLYPNFKVRDMGILDGVVEPDALVPAAIEAIEAWTPSPNAFAEIKRRLHAPTLAAIEAAGDEREAFVRGWFDEEAQRRMRAAVEQLRGDRS